MSSHDSSPRLSHTSNLNFAQVSADPSGFLPPSLEDRVLRTIVEGVETQAGDDFFCSLVKHLATALNVKYAYISEFREDQGCFWSCAGWGPTGPLPPFQVPLGGPCEAVLQRGMIFHQCNLPSLYPQSQMIREWKAQSYCGIPLLDSSAHVAGHLAVLDDNPLRNGEFVTSILRIFRVKAQAETERRKLFQALRKSDLILRQIDLGTASVTGEEFFRALAQNLASALNVRYVFVGELLKSKSRVRTQVFWAGGDFLENFEYDLAGTPCEQVLHGKVCHFAQGIQSLFPHDRDLVKLQAESYLAVPLCDVQGNVVGHLAALDVRPMPMVPQDLSIFNIFSARAGSELVRLRLQEQTDRHPAILQTIDEGTAAVTGQDFFNSLVRCLAMALGVRYAFVSEFAETKTRVRTLAFWQGEGFLDNFEYDLDPSPCKKVLEGEVCHYPERIQELFPREEGLVHLHAESYLAIPLTNQRGEILGHLAALDVHPMPLEPSTLSVFKIFGARAGAELQRMYMEAELRDNEERMRDLFDEAPIAYVHEGLDTRFIRANRTAMNILGITPDQVEGTYGRTFIPETPDAQRRLKEALESIGRGTDTSGVVLELRRKDNGKPLWIQWWSKPDPSGTYTRTMFLDITDRVLMEQEKARLEAQNLYLQEEIKTEHNFGEIIGNSASIRMVLKAVEKVAATDTTVLVTGETGTGKELIARAIHDRSGRKKKPLVKVNCAAIPTGLIESELFGHERGAFTGALARKIGRFEVANGGTIFLDEIGELPLDLQSKLLRVLQEGEFERVGSSHTQRVDVRVITATNRDLNQCVQTGQFRPDLFYRLNVFPILLPPLRDRAGDISLLAKYFTQHIAGKLGKRVERIPHDVVASLERYHWPGNVRELEHVIERAVILTEGKDLIPVDWLHTPSQTREGTQFRTLEEVERDYIVGTLERTNGRVSGKGGAAALLGLKPTTLEARIKKLEIERKNSRNSQKIGIVPI